MQIGVEMKETTAHMNPNGRDCSNMQERNRRKLCLSIGLSVVMLLVPIALSYANILELYTNYLLRIDEGSLLHGLLLRPFPGIKFHVYIFNVTNAQEFLRGEDRKVRVEEVGPFVYQEIRYHEDVVVNVEPGIMQLTPKLNLVFFPEESIGHPNETYLTLPNIPLLSITALIGRYPYLVQRFYNMLVTSTASKPFKRTSVQDILWGYEDPFIALANKLAPGMVYFKTFGILERLFDMKELNYRLEVRTNNAEKFSVRKSTKSKPKQTKIENDAFIKQTLYFDNHTFEGAVFPPGLSPNFPIKIYRTGYCHTLDLQFNRTRSMYYGGDGLVYTLKNSFINDRRQCDTKGWCPSGLKDASSCYFNLPLVVSKGHFLDADPRLLDMVEGLKPDSKLYDSELVVDPKIGVTIEGTFSAQLSLFLANMAFNTECRRLHDTVLPLVRYHFTSPPLIAEAQCALDFVYKQGPYILLAAQIFFVLCGLALLAYSFRIWRCNWLDRKKQIDYKRSITQRPLLK